MAKRLVVANWKMEPDTLREAVALFAATKRLAERFKKVEVVASPPFVFLSSFFSRDKGSLILGSQDIFWAKGSAFTGEISALMLSHLGVRYSIIGHSERRALGEDDESINKKIKAALYHKITPILCVGERERDDHAHYLTFLKNQIKNSLSKIKREEVRKIVIAYEPIWAIGKSAKDAITPERLHEMVIFIRKVLSDIFGREAARAVRIIYGGSVEAANASPLLKEGQVSGFLVGHTSLDPDKFKVVLEAAQS